MPNVRDDVLLIQTLLKLANFTGNGADEASAAILIDGCFNEQTKRMIQTFENCVREKNLLLTADGVFEPSSNYGYTPQGVIYKIIHLNRLARQAAAFGSKYSEIATDPETHPQLRQALLTQICLETV